MIVIDDKIVALWNFRIDEKSDWLGGLREIKPDEEYEFSYRFRYYKDDKHFESADVKNWYSMKLKAVTRNYALLNLRRIVADIFAMRSDFPDSLFEVVNEDGDVKAFMAKFEARPNVFSRMETIKPE